MCWLTIILSMFTSNFNCSTVFRASAILAMLLDILHLSHWSQPACSKTPNIELLTHHWRGGKNINTATPLKCTERDNLLKVLSWLESVSICSLILLPGSQLQVAGRLSKEKGRGGGGRLTSPGGGHPLAEKVNTPNININLLLFQNTFVQNCRSSDLMLNLCTHSCCYVAQLHRLMQKINREQWMNSMISQQQKSLTLICQLSQYNEFRHAIILHTQHTCRYM